MPKKEKTWTIGMPKGRIGPFVWQAWVNGSQKPIRMIAFDLKHIKDQLEGKTVIKAIKEKQKKIDKKSGICELQSNDCIFKNSSLAKKLLKTVLSVSFAKNLYNLLKFRYMFINTLRTICTPTIS